MKKGAATVAPFSACAGRKPQSDVSDNGDPTTTFKNYAGLSHRLGQRRSVAMVDIVLGPLIVFLVYDRRKNNLRRDFALIICIQLTATACGIQRSALAWPVTMTLAVVRFELVSAAGVDAGELAKAPEQFRKLSWSGPVLAAAHMPDNREEREQILFAGASYGIDLRHLLRYYVDYRTQGVEVIARSRPLADLDRYNNPAEVAEALTTIREVAAHPDRLRYLPVQGPKEDLVAIIDSGDATVLRTVRLKPWD